MGSGKCLPSARQSHGNRLAIAWQYCYAVTKVVRFFNAAPLAQGSSYNVGLCSCWQATCFEDEVLDCTALKYYKCQTGSKSTFGHFVRDVLQKSVVLLLMRNTTGDRTNSKAVGFLLENWEKHDCTQHDKKYNIFGLHSFLPRKMEQTSSPPGGPTEKNKVDFSISPTGGSEM